MKVHFRQSGGFAGLLRAAEVDTKELAPAEARSIEELVREVLDATPARAHTPGADITRYELTVDDGSGPCSCAFDDANASPAASKLLGLLQAKTRPTRPR
jgi:hypothetical protein